MIKKITSFTIVFMLAMIMFSSGIEEYYSFDNASEQLETINEVQKKDRYSLIYEKWISEGLSDTIDENGIAFPYPDFILNPDDKTKHLVSNDETNGYQQFLSDNGLEGAGLDVLFFDPDLQTNEVSFEFDVKTTGLYIIGLDYYSKTKNIRPIEISVMVNDNYQYYEASQVSLDTFWKTSNEFATDEKGSDIMPKSEQINFWSHAYLRDTTKIHDYPLTFKLEAGKNKITIIKNSGDFLLGNVYYEKQLSYIGYDEYLKKYPDVNTKDDLFLETEAENMSLKNTPSIRYATDKDAGVTPLSLVENRLNVIDSASYDQGGNGISYDVKIDRQGLYKITVKYKQNTYQNFLVYRTVKINDVIPFEEALQIPFEASPGWSNNTLKDLEGNELYFYFHKGTNRITFEANIARNGKVYEIVNDIMAKINELSLDIRKITGNNPDIDRDWNILEYLPDLQDNLFEYSDKLKEIYNNFQNLNRSVRNSQVASGLKMASDWLYELAEYPDEVPRKLAKLSTGSSSITQKLGTILPIIIESPLTFDKFYIHGDNAVIPDSNVNFFVGIWTEIKRFFMSFFSGDYIVSRDGTELEIWTTKSRQYMNLMQQMADRDFTPKTGIKVRFSIMSDESKLILSNSADKQPDLAMGIAGWRPYEFSLRDALYDFRKFEDFPSIATRFVEGAFLQQIYQEGVYGIPETTNFQLLFYRKDILDMVGIPVPDTWNDVIAILPELQRYGMNFYVPLSKSGALKTFDATMPFIYQFGGKIYEDDAYSAAIDDPNTVEALRFMTDLFTIYSLPREVGSFYNSFRYGSIPIGIGDFSMYVQLLHAAPEIVGLWDIAPIPGVMNDDGIVDRSYVGAATSSMIFKNGNKQNEAWEFLKWWTETEIQLEYAETLVTSMGPEYMWNTSNVEAFSNFSWEESHKEAILDQWQWVYDVPKTPGTYILERELSNIWNKTVFEGENVRSAVEESIIVIDKELTRKMYEFGYTDKNGVPLKPYIMPSKETIGEWLK